MSAQEDAIDRELNAALYDEIDSGSDSDGGIEIIEVKPKPVAGKPTPGASAQSSASANSGGLKAVRCPICLDPPEILAVAECGHIYCHECIFPALSASGNADRRHGICGMCRQKVMYAKTMYLEARVGTKPKDGEPSSRPKGPFGLVK